MREIEINWIEEGYETFAYEGSIGLKVERLSKKANKNKSIKGIPFDVIRNPFDLF